MTRTWFSDDDELGYEMDLGWPVWLNEWRGAQDELEEEELVVESELREGMDEVGEGVLDGVKNGLTAPPHLLDELGGAVLEEPFFDFDAVLETPDFASGSGASRAPGVQAVASFFP